MKVYISGPRVKENGKEKGLQAEFLLAEAKLAANGLVPVFALVYCDAKDRLRMLMECESIYMLDGWEKSRESTLERNVALHLGMFISYVLDESYFEDDSYSENQLDLLDAE
tara:strand:- start:22902 stop:23234 length:333 start_codon:yes stop_codon:yes gene_type:complete